MKPHKTIAALCGLAVVALLTMAFFVQSYNFNSNQFVASAPYMSIKDSVLLTNAQVWTSFSVVGTNANSYFAGTVNATNGFTAIGGVFTGNGSGLTNLPGGGGGVVAAGRAIAVGTNGSVYTVNSDVTDPLSLSIDEEFLNGSPGGGTIGNYGWTSQLINSGAFSGNNATVAAHPGIVRLDTAATGGSGATLCLSDSGTPGHMPIFGMQTVPWRMRLIFETSSTNHQRFWYGVASGTWSQTNLPTTGVFVVYDALVSQSLQLTCADGAGSASVNLAVAQNTVWYDMLVGSDTAGTVWATINGTTGFTNTTHCPSAALTPVAQNALEDAGASAVSLFLDAFKLWQTYPQRF